MLFEHICVQYTPSQLIILGFSSLATQLAIRFDYRNFGLLIITTTATNIQHLAHDTICLPKFYSTDFNQYSLCVYFNYCVLINGRLNGNNVKIVQNWYTSCSLAVNNFVVVVFFLVMQVDLTNMWKIVCFFKKAIGISCKFSSNPLFIGISGVPTLK